VIAEDDVNGDGRQIEVVGTSVSSGAVGDHGIKFRCMYGLYDVAKPFTSRKEAGRPA